jgi:hypothetical protein
MTPARGLSPADVHITRHATEQLLLRFPSDLLPRSPEAYLRRLLRLAQPATPAITHRYRLSLRPDARLLCAEGWVLPLAPNRAGTPPWVLLTALRRSPADNMVTHALRSDRLQGHAAFRSGAAFTLLASLILETGIADPACLGRLWHERRYPLVLWGGYETFAEFWRDARRVMGRAGGETDYEPGRSSASSATPETPHQAAG